MFDLKTPRDFIAKLEADFADWEREPGSSGLALNCAITAYHFHEWVWSHWLKRDDSARRALGIGKKRGDFIRWIERACVWFGWIQELATGAKHSNDLSFKALRVSRLPFTLDVPDAGLDEGAWDGPMPFVVGGPMMLLIDNGPDALEHQYMPVGHLLEVVVRFWREFFDRYAPPAQRAITDSVSAT